MGAARDSRSDTVNGRTGADRLRGGGFGIELLSSSPWAIVLTSADGRIKFVNTAGLALFEIAPDEDVLGTAFSDLWPEGERATLSRSLESAGSGVATQYSALCPSRNGTPRWLEAALTVTPSREADSEYEPCVMCSMRDITQQMAVQESLKNSQQRFRALADHMAQLAWMADGTGRLFWYNKRWFDYTGTTMTETEGWGWLKQQHPDHLDRVTRKWTAHLQSGEVWEDVFPLRGHDGTFRWFLSRAMPFKDASGHITLWCGTNTDITEERKATQRLRQKARLIELSHEAIFSWNFDDGILSWNRGCEELYGYTQREALGAVSHELLKSQTSIPLSELRHVLETEGSWAGEILHIGKDDTKVWVDSRLELIRVGGKPMVLETNRDVTERRKSDEIRNLLVAELNHRVKNTLAIVQSIASQTARTSSDMREYADNFRGRLQSLASAHNILTDAHWYGADLHKLVQSEIDVTFGQSANLSVSGDPVFLSPQTALNLTLIVHELATNALRHGALSTPAGHVEVTWKRLPEDEGKLEIVWHESGGPTVSQPVHRGFGTTLIGRSGALPNIKTELLFKPEGVKCRVVADLKQDRLADPVLFNPGRKELALVTGQRTPKRARSTASKKILFVGHEPTLAFEVEDTLNEAGYEPVGPATSLQGAFDVIARGDTNVVLVDCGLIFGEQLDTIVDRMKSGKVPYVLLGADSDVGGLSRHGVPVLNKPLRPRALMDALACVLPSAKDIAS